MKKTTGLELLETFRLNRDLANTVYKYLGKRAELTYPRHVLFLDFCYITRTDLELIPAMKYMYTYNIRWKG